MAHGTVIGDILEFFPVTDRHPAARLLFVQEGFDQGRGGQDLVAWRIQQIGARDVGGADRFALAAPQAVLDAGGNFADIALLHDQRLVAHQAERRRVGVAQVGVGAFQIEQLALVEAPFRIDADLVVAEFLDFFVLQELAW